MQSILLARAKEGEMIEVKINEYKATQHGAALRMIIPKHWASDNGIRGGDLLVYSVDEKNRLIIEPKKGQEISA
jgi:antitoxin component of MazEF toxin-antitoxin module